MNVQLLYQNLFQAVRLAGRVALMMQEGIVNEGKSVEKEEGESAHHKAMREAKTKADEIVQELLLGAVMKDGKDLFTLDVEEDTASIAYYTRKDHAYTLVIDPIDGTLDYLQQKDTYSICCSLIHEGELLLALVYFPLRDILYGYYEGNKAQIYTEAWMKDWNEGEEVRGSLKQTSLIYKNSRVGDEVCTEVAKRGYEIVDEIEHGLCCPEAILRCMKGEALAYYADHRNIRDILLGAILSKMEGGHACDFAGHPLRWNAGGRQEEAVFTLCDPKTLFRKLK